MFRVLGVYNFATYPLWVDNCKNLYKLPPLFSRDQVWTFYYPPSLFVRSSYRMTSKTISGLKKSLNLSKTFAQNIFINFGSMWSLMLTSWWLFFPSEIYPFLYLILPVKAKAKQAFSLKGCAINNYYYRFFTSWRLPASIDFQNLTLL